MAVQIIKKDTVVKRHAESVGTLLQEAIRVMNHRLEKCLEIPVFVPESELGKTAMVRNEMIRQLVSAGWQVKPADAKDHGEIGFYLS